MEIFEFNNSTGMLAVDRLSRRLDQEENTLRMALMNLMINHGQPLQEDDLGRLPELAGLDLERSYPALIDKRVLVRDAGKILFIYPVSALPRP